MAQLSLVTGVDEVISKLRVWDKRYEKRFAAGMKVAGLFLQRESQKIVPVDTGILRSTAFTRATGFGFATDVLVGYTAAYAIFVHEDLDAAHGTAFNQKHAAAFAAATTKRQKQRFAPRGPNQQAKFLEKPLREQRDKLLQIIVRISLS